MKIISKMEEWNNILDTLFDEEKDVYYRFEYFNLYSRHYNSKPEAIFWEDSNVSVFWTHLIRNIEEVKQYGNFEYHDLITPYGYGGPLIIFRNNNKKEVEASIKYFFKEYTQHCLENNYVSEFIRFHPIYDTSLYFMQEIDIQNLNETIAINLENALEDIWAGIKKGHRYNIKKSISNGCKVEITNKPTSEELKTFIKLYNETMDKNNAARKYYFTKKFIEDHFQLLDSILIKIIYDEEIIGAAMFIFNGKVIHYHLSGMNYNFKKLYSTDLMLWEVIKWGKEKGFKYLHLGGGVSKNDSLFKFKRGFSNDVYQFYIGKHIFDKDIYNKLTQINQKNGSESSFFPAYRQNKETII
ncbi:MAG: peptidoglycan bridge formation glycyltransferase FemA/FemB family protein [Methanosarcinaceae archaeon]|nr:peptidoglycan bridge formation glycyltransferase FemA/FemB family protein [Methanosarcinaceae archaeon]